MKKSYFDLIFTKKSDIIVLLMGGDPMKSKNICKFPSATFGNCSLLLHRFVQESKAEVMHTRSALKAHRMLIVTGGSGVFSIGGGEYRASQGTLLFGFDGEDFVLLGGELLYIYVDFSGARANELLSRFDINTVSRFFDGCEGLIPLWQESVSRASDENIDLLAESVLLYTFSRISPRDSADNGIVSEITSLTEEHFNDPELSISSVAMELSYNPKYLSSLFKRKVGISYSEYLRSVRLKYAISLFEHGIDSVKNVALLSGFTDSLYFSKVFKSSIGVSPKAFIESIKEKD